jgi:hypothetical protein
LAWADAAMDQVLAGMQPRIPAWPLLPLRWTGRRRARILDERITKPFLIDCLIIARLALVPGLIGLAYLIHWLASPHRVSKSAPVRQVTAHAAQQSQSGTPLWTWVFLAFLVLLIVWSAVGKSLDRVTEADEALREAQTRSQAYSLEDMSRMLGSIRTVPGIKRLCRMLHHTPQLCPPEVVNLLSDLATAAERGGHMRYFPGSPGGRWGPRLSARPAIVKIPPGSSTAFIQWASTSPDKLADLLLSIDEEAVDEVTTLVTELRSQRADRPDAAQPSG